MVCGLPHPAVAVATNQSRYKPTSLGNAADDATAQIAGIGYGVYLYRPSPVQPTVEKFRLKPRREAEELYILLKQNLLNLERS